ncbi:hypothetical protein FEM48_Zijuj02G0002400 [Ziziphus jujuba var. spinosa]|uniref:Uncharacterized protein n=1 Tax=Ziziphus jujuba var. spinosa TaxID=714518 RepID=A0A978VSH0_ZIZJJ|nr:hypothetical protein FEM48_Zijuj02G0002400 [Ziziphus jujuba var. spinosa]
MASRMVARFVPRRFSSSGKILSEEEKAAENKIEQEKLEKLARKGPKPDEATETSGGSVADSKPSGSTSSAGGASTERVSTDKYRNYAVVAGVVTGLGALGWYLKSNAKKPEVQD